MPTEESGFLHPKSIAIAKKLRDDEKFYKLCSHTIRKRFKGFYTEDAWKENWKVTNK